jgi:hypothetical protein
MALTSSSSVCLVPSELNARMQSSGRIEGRSGRLWCPSGGVALEQIPTPSRNRSHSRCPRPATPADAELVGVSSKPRQAQLPLVVDTTGVHRRRNTWLATTGRAGRWGAIVKAGARIRAADLDTYRLPRPLEEKRQQRGGALVTNHG